ncbi:hypothetical protein NG2371_02131 [Nocardia gamkensis]|nr:hypothetical protein [Nocardia gamkensis]
MGTTADRLPELTIVCGHIGYPWTEEMIAVARKHENVVIDTSAYTTKRLPAELVSYLKSRSGRRKVLFGTNYPMIFPQHALDGLAALGLDDETRSLYLDGNARRVFGLAGRPNRMAACRVGAARCSGHKMPRHAGVDRAVARISAGSIVGLTGRRAS